MTFLNWTLEQWIDLAISIIIVLLALIAGRWLVRIILERLLRRIVGLTRTTLDDAILEAAHGPLHWLIIAIAFDVGLRRLDAVPAQWRPDLEDAFFVIYYIIAALFLLRLASHLMIWYSERMAEVREAPVVAHMMPFLRRLVLILLGIIALINLLGHFTDVTALITTLGVGSLAIALAAQTALEDLFSGFLIMLDRPYRIGDRVEILDLQTWGDVTDIGLRSTRIRTRDNRTVVIANSIISKSMIVNHSYPDSQYRIQVHIGIAYGSDIELARRTMIKAVRGVEGVLETRPVEALFIEFGDSALIFRVRWWIESYEDTRRMFDKVNTAVYHALEEAGIEIPFPQRDVHHYLDEDQASRLAHALRARKSR